jgi:peroxiredoxin Q/BCP
MDARCDRSGRAVKEAVRGKRRREGFVDAGERRLRLGGRVADRHDGETGPPERDGVAPGAAREVDDADAAARAQALDQSIGERMGLHNGVGAFWRSRRFAHAPPASRKGNKMLGEGDQLPAVTLLDDLGNQVTTTDLLGAPLVLYFYPKDDTPGCTSEASQFRDSYPLFQKKNARIVGVSRDSVESHQRFKEKYSIPFTLLADTDSKLYQALGVNARSTFLIDETGRIVKTWPKVNVAEHAEDVLESMA